MNKTLRILLLSSCCLLALNVRGQENETVPRGAFEQGTKGMPGNPFFQEERMGHREEARQRREIWRQMSPEERHRLRSDIRDAGQSLYPRRHRGRDAGR